MEPKESAAEMAERQAHEAECARGILKSFLQMEGVRVGLHGVQDEEEEEEELEQGLLSLFSGSAYGGNSGLSDEEEDEQRPTFVTETYTRKNPKAAGTTQLELSLVASHHSLWGHKIWNAAKVLGEMIEDDPSLVKEKACLELGAGAALPSLLAALNGARHVIASDYASSSDQLLVHAMQANIDRLMESASTVVPPGVLTAVGYIWGQPVGPLLAPLTNDDDGTTHKFDVILCADCIFNRSEHKQLLKSLRECLAEGGQVLVSYSHHDPEKRALDMVFFTLATQEEEDGVGGWEVEDVRIEQCVDLFVENDGLDQERGLVYVKRLRLKPQQQKAIVN